MNPFPTGDLAWAQEGPRFHIRILLPQGDLEFADLVTRTQPVLDEFAAELVPIPSRPLHATAQAVSVPAAEVSHVQRATLAATIERNLATLRPFTLTAGSPHAGSCAVLSDLDGDEPGEPWQTLSEAVTSAIGPVCGPQDLAYRPGPPHISLGYCARETGPGVVEPRQCRAIRPSHTPFTVDAVYVVDVGQDVNDHLPSWSTPLARIPLGRRASDD